MRTWRTVSLASFAVLLLAFAVLVSLPLRFPGSVISWKPLVLFLTPAVAITLLLPLRQRWGHRRYRVVLLLAALLLIALAVLGLLAFPVLALSLAGLGGLYLGSRQLDRSGSMTAPQSPI